MEVFDIVNVHGWNFWKKWVKTSKSTEVDVSLEVSTYNEWCHVVFQCLVEPGRGWFVAAAS